MNKIFSILLGLAISAVSVQAAEIPYSPELEAALAGKKHVIRAVYSAGTGDNGSSTVNSGVHKLGVAVPAKAVITDSYAVVTTSLVESDVGGNGKIGLKCNSSSDIFAATDFSTDGTFFHGKQFGLSTVFLEVGSTPCNLSAEVTVDGFTSGRVVFFLEYVLGE